MSWLLNILVVLINMLHSTISDVPPNNNQQVDLVTKPYYLRKLATMEIKFAQNSALLLHSLPLQGQNLVNEYIKEFLRANANLTGFSFNQDTGASAEAIAFNPIATFHLVHRFRTQLLKLKEYLSELNSPLIKLLESEQWFNADDFLRSVNNIVLITHVYNLPISEVANGIFEDVRTGTTLNAQDCYLIGHAAIEASFHAQSILFLEEALERSENDGSIDTVFVERVLNDTIKLHDKNLKTVDPDALLYFFNRKIGPLRTRFPEQYKWMRTLNRLNLGKSSQIPDLCKFGSLQTDSVKKDLFCWYETTTNPYFIINPLKMEVLSFKPELVQVYEIVGEKKMEFIKEYCDNRSRLNYTNVHDGLTTETVLIDESHHSELKTMPKTLEKLTQLSIVAPGATRNLRVITYETGGYFYPHMDALTRNRDGPDQVMSSTFLYYVEEPILGGATTFEAAKLAVKPIKGSGVFYYNIRSDWDGDTNNIHSGCPIILGRKRAAGKPTYALEQMLTIKCYPNPLTRYRIFTKSRIYQQKRNKFLKGK